MTAPALLLTLAGLTAGLAYTLACWLAPFGPCARCKGTNRLCRRCDGTGRRVRAGRRLWTYLHRLHDQGTDPQRRHP